MNKPELSSGGKCNFVTSGKSAPCRGKSRNFICEVVFGRLLRNDSRADELDFVPRHVTVQPTAKTEDSVLRFRAMNMMHCLAVAEIRNLPGRDAFRVETQ